MMGKQFFYDSPILPPGFRFPQAILDMVKKNEIPDLEPWRFLFLDMPSSLNYYGAMLQKYPEKPLIPFAILEDPSGTINDGYVVLACFDGDDRDGEPKVYYHDYGSRKRVGWADRHFLATFSDWLRVAEEESVRYKAERDEDDE